MKEICGIVDCDNEGKHCIGGVQIGSSMPELTYIMSGKYPVHGNVKFLSKLDIPLRKICDEHLREVNSLPERRAVNFTLPDPQRQEDLQPEHILGT